MEKIASCITAFSIFILTTRRHCLDSRAYYTVIHVVKNLLHPVDPEKSRIAIFLFRNPATTLPRI